MEYILKTEEFKGHKITINAKTGVLAEVWFALSDLKLETLITDGKVENIKPAELIKELFINKKLDKFCNIIAKNIPIEVDMLDFEDTVKIISTFFQTMGKPLKELITSVIATPTA